MSYVRDGDRKYIVSEEPGDLHYGREASYWTTSEDYAELCAQRAGRYHMRGGMVLRHDVPLEMLDSAYHFPEPEPEPEPALSHGSEQLIDDRPYIKNSEEIEAIPFTWTPELARLTISRGGIHPFLGPLEPSNEYPYYIFHPDWALPDPADTRECLKWVGLSDDKIIQVEQKFNELYPDYQGPVCGYDEKYTSGGTPGGRNYIDFPVVARMVKVYYGMVDHWSSDHEYTHEGYIKKAIQQGLRPEFAVSCGMHKDDPRCVDDPLLFERDWFDTAASSIVVRMVRSHWDKLSKFLLCKLCDEGKAWRDDYDHGLSEWLVHEGESMKQAKERVNNLDRQALCERAYKEEREKIKRESEEYRKRIEQEVAEAEAEYRSFREE
ncbi:uncharacterized protein LDX57_010432 [Aspergillus melleus]|nr:uncharacterized protein LDX57_010432 [Aspergillus melleus]KAH8432803.1 hypothetical protein LDX57_010432 [Aspergillus melleus]